MRKFCLLLLFLFLGLLGYSQNGKISESDSIARKIPYIRKMSIMNILSEKEIYDGKLVKISGYLKVTNNFFGNLFFSKEFADNFSFENAIYFDIPQNSSLLQDLMRKCENYTTVVGIINFTKHGPKGEYIAEFDKIFSFGPIR